MMQSQTLGVLRLALASLAVSGIVSAFAIQVPLNVTSTDRGRDEHLGILGGKDSQEPQWNFNELPNPNATDHLVFETVHSLLQQWPNTRIRNGHNIVPGVIPRGTLLHHGTGANELPQGPEWLATDPEHSYFFCQDEFIQSPLQCQLFTVATTRSLKIVYFDGNSAAKIPYGSLDTQDLLIWGEVRPERVWDEEPRINDLCDWAKEVGVDGFVRMQMSFEIMLCDFRSHVKLVSSASLARPRVLGAMYLGNSVVFETINAGSRHNHFPGETRIQLDLAGLVSFYDSQLAPSLVPIRAGLERWDHRVQNISSQDLSALKARLEHNLANPSGSSTGIDWKALIHAIVDLFADRLELTRHLLSLPATNPNEVIDLANKTQSQLRIMLNSYLDLSASPTDSFNDAALDWAVPVYKSCATTYTNFIDSEFNLMTESEKLIHGAIRGTSQEICRVVTKMWVAGVYAGIDHKLNKKDPESLDIAEITTLRSNWAKDLNALMAWLDWSVWVKCNPACRPEELCYLPTWPLGFPWFDKDPAKLHDADPSRLRGRWSSFEAQFKVMQHLAEEPGLDEWSRPQPRCIGRVYPYQF